MLQNFLLYTLSRGGLGKSIQISDGILFFKKYRTWQLDEEHYK